MGVTSRGHRAVPWSRGHSEDMEVHGMARAYSEEQVCRELLAQLCNGLDGSTLQVLVKETDPAREPDGGEKHTKTLM